jgi:hypothetical protein
VFSADKSGHYDDLDDAVESSKTELKFYNERQVKLKEVETELDDLDNVIAELIMSDKCYKDESIRRDRLEERRKALMRGK